MFDENKKPNIISVLVPYPLPKPYSYIVPDDLEIGVGDYIIVPFGKKQVIGVAWDYPTENYDISKLKTIISKFEFPKMRIEMMKLIEFVSKYTMSEMGAVLKMALSSPDALEYIKGSKAYTLGNIEGVKISPARQKIIDILQDSKPISAKILSEKAECGRPVIKSMASLGMLNEIDISVTYPCQNPKIQETDLELSISQIKAADKLKSAINNDNSKPILLDGVTGAGKTEVYFEAVLEALKSDKQVLILLPEIALSTQFITKFERRFGIKPAIWHSNVTKVQKKLIWQGVAYNKTKVVIGARSSLFLPFSDLGLIIIDEEHDPSYKQEDGVFYNARDMAVVRASLEKSAIFMVSATPSLETFVNVKNGKYDIAKLDSRFGNAMMPDINIIDMRKDKAGSQCFISNTLREAVKSAFDNKEQSILFLNRRGYAPLTLCRKCGFRFQCPTCTSWLVEHRKYKNLQCHHCGYNANLPKKCPDCEEEDSFAACGPGVERIEEEIKHFLPDAKTLILASDVVTTPKQIEDAINKISNQEVDIIIGTQIVAKGHHFPMLTCVGVIDADSGLTGGDLRASERVFQLLHQVSGRAGREKAKGEVYIQSFMPEHRVINALKDGDRDGFLDVEMSEREEALMPPFGKLASLIISSKDANILDKFCKDMIKIAPNFENVMILGPAEAAMAILRGKHRRRFLIRTAKDISIQKIINEWLENIKKPSIISLRIDIDPQSFL